MTLCGRRSRWLLHGSLRRHALKLAGIACCVVFMYAFLYAEEPGQFRSLYETARAPVNIVSINDVNAGELFDRLVIVTAVSQNHLQEAKGMVATVQQFLPRTRIIMYNLGLNSTGLEEARRLCNVELRPFDFGKYPAHFRNLKQYAWKVLIISQTLQEFGVIFWCDASARFRRDPRLLFSSLHEQHGFMFHVEEYWYNQLVRRTHPDMFREFGIDLEKFIADRGYTTCIEANRLLMVNTALVRRKIVAPWVDCALRRRCITPWFSFIPENINFLWWHTHRYDQAALSLIVYKNLRGMWYEQNDKTPLFHSVVTLRRSTSGWERAQFCRGGPS